MAAFQFNFRDGLKRIQKSLRFDRGATWGIIIILALAAFEIFNFSTTEFALTDVLGTNLEFAGIRWATILAVAFCGIDFAGIARIFTPEKGRSDPAEVYYLFGAWFLAAGFNAVLTWWGISIAISSNTSLGSGTVIRAATMNNVVPIFIAIMVWLIRILIIGTFSLSGDRLFTTDTGRTLPTNSFSSSSSRQINQPSMRSASGLNSKSDAYAPRRNAPKPSLVQSSDNRNYQSLQYGAQPAVNNERSYE
jgi:hypothetical protein